MRQNIFVIAFVIHTLFSCSHKSEEKGEDSYINQGNSSSKSNTEYLSVDGNYLSDESNEGTNQGNDEYSNECKFEDGTYSATVDYNNPETGYSATYTLDVEVVDCQIVQIYFPNDGYLDEDHISYADIDQDGNAIVDGEDGKTYEIQIDN
jgi:hypothetical protein